MPVHAIVSTHTPRHLRRTLLGLACQSVPPASVVVTSDTDDAAIGLVAADAAPDFGLAILLAQRPFQGQSRSSQVRNNGVRALLSRGAASRDVLVFLDGDCCPAPDAISAHLRLLDGRSREVVVGFRIDLSPAQTEAFDESRLRLGKWPVEPTPEQLQGLRSRHRRYLRHAWMRRLGIAKAHKPKLLSANFALPLSLYQQVNGFDETYEGYGQEDDDLGRRLYAAGARPIIAVADAIVFHQHHPTRAPQDWDKSPNAARFARPFTARCSRGLENPASQPDPTFRQFAPAPSAPGAAPSKQSPDQAQEPAHAP
jgi:hypothetical protein